MMCYSTKVWYRGAKHTNVADMCPVSYATQFRQGQEFTPTPGAHSAPPMVLAL